MAGNESGTGTGGGIDDADHETLCDRLVLAALPHIETHGWGMAALRRGAADLGIAPGMAMALFPGRGRDMIARHSDLADRQMLAALAKIKLDALPVRRRIAEAVMIRLEQNRDHRVAVRRGLGHLMLPGSGPSAMGMLYRTVDAIWRAAGDRATDWNFYSKRGLLAGIYLATLPVWLADADADLVETRAFLERRIAAVMQIPQRTAGLRGRLESAAKFAGRMAAGRCYRIFPRPGGAAP